jgi:hypothetical protein
MAKVPVGGNAGILIGITTTAGGVIVPIKMAQGSEIGPPRSANAKLEDFVRI